MVCFITVAGFLSGPGFEKMRDYLRRSCDDIWILDCSPEGYQPNVNTRIFEAVQQPVCIVLASRSAKNDIEVPAKVHFQALPASHRTEKFAALSHIILDDKSWVECPSDWRAPFLPASTGAWAAFPKLEEFFVYNGAGVQAKRTWVMAPDAKSLIERWKDLINAPEEKKEELFHPTLRGGKPADRHIRSVIHNELPGFKATPTKLIDEKGSCPPPVRYGFRSFNRQWIIPDSRVITQPNAELWQSRSAQQVYMTAFTEESPSGGPAITFTGLVPDLHHYKGSFGGRVFPLWSNAKATRSNLRPKLVNCLNEIYGETFTAEDVIAYIGAVAAHPAYTARFQQDMSTPGIRIPLTADPKVFAKTVELGRKVIWLHTFGERMADTKQGRPAAPPRLPEGRRPRIPKGGAIPEDSNAMPDTMKYDAEKKRLLIGTGYIENVEPAVWAYEVSGKQVLAQWFSYRKKDRERPLIGDRRTPSPLGDIQPDHWLPEYTTELLNVLNVLGLLVEMEPQQASLLEKVCAGPTLSAETLNKAGAFELPETPKILKKKPEHPDQIKLGLEQGQE
jgi:hypothetical protein